MSSELVNKGMAQVFTGLGILLGAGRISSTTHEEIMALLNAEPDPMMNTDLGVNMRPNPTIPTQTRGADMGEILGGLPRPRQETPVSSAPSQDLLGLGMDLVEAAQPSRTSRANTNPGMLVQQEKLICPWFAMEGYSCREHDQGKCPFYHDRIPDGLSQPLICHFWDDGKRCTKSAKECRFAHYKAKHNVVAPQPKGKSKKLRSSLAEDAGLPNPIKPSRHISRDDEEGQEVWYHHGRPRPKQEW